MTRWKGFLWTVAFVGSVVITTAGSLFLLTRPSLREIMHWPSPDGHYHLILLEGDTDWRGFPFFTKPHYFFYAGRESHSPTYGHEQGYELHSDMAGYCEKDLSVYLHKSTVTWSAEGLSFEEPSGHRVFIPKTAYEGGR
jgi:hypothetical protein